MSPRALLLPAALIPFVISACASRAEPAPPAEPASAPELAAPAAPLSANTASEEEDEDAVTGKSLYARHCAGCHNDNGDGRGATMLQQGKQARSFAQGGFAFGNTVEAIAKTIASGIPGSSPMQAFKAVMDEDELRMVAEHVLTLTPYKAEVKAKDSELVVGERAVIARGKLPAIREGLDEHPRGLMVGLPGGLSFEYRLDDVRLLAVRRGAFVDRTDWNERGGGELKPLGELLFEPEQLGDSSRFSAYADGGEWRPIELELAATRVTQPRAGEAQLEWRPVPGALPGVRRVVETLFQPRLSERECFGRRLAVERGPSPSETILTLVDRGEQSQGTNLRAPNAARPGQPGSKTPDDGWNVLKLDDRFECVQVLIDKASGARPGGNARFLGATWSTRDAEAPAPVEIRVVVVRVNAWDEALLARWTKELAE